MNDPVYSRIPYRLAWILACLTFPLIWVGGLVTTYGAGMAVPDWPNTFGYNLFLYPLESWLHVWDVCLEHSHRLIGATTGMAAIALALALWRLEPRRWVRRLGWVALAAVCLQGLLGGLRVTENAIFLAKVHGCTAPVFFALAASLVAFTSPAWRREILNTKSEILNKSKILNSNARPNLVSIFRSAFLIALGIYLQIVLGAQLRHPTPDMAPELFRLWLWLHLILAGVLLAVIVVVWLMARKRYRDEAMLSRRVRWLLWLFPLQLLLGLAAWITHYNWPQWWADWFWEIEYTAVANGRLQAALTTAHVAVGSLLLVVALSLALWSWRLTAGAERA